MQSKMIQENFGSAALPTVSDLAARRKTVSALKPTVAELHARKFGKALRWPR
jgi:hypothetical protein